MSKKIIVAGLGHGGIAAAALLAEAGYDVTVYEKKEEGTLGYDWTDIFAPKALEIAKIPMPDEDKFEYKEDMTFFAPSGNTPLRQHIPHDKLEIKMERKDIYDLLIKNAVEKGVKIVYGCEVQKPIMLGNRVAGIRTANSDVFGDLVIDSCGMNSPIRRNLPKSLMIEKDITRNQKIAIFRAFYNKASDCEVEAKFKVMVCNGGVQGISWVASEDEHTDLLIGRFNDDFDMEDVEEFAEFLRPTNPRLGTEIVRGGQFVEIPVRHPLSVMVADGYAAIGDSAFMTVPLIGSGIANSLKAARILAETVINDHAQAFSVESLWKYQVLFYKHVGSGLAPLECIKQLLFKFTYDEIDYCFDSGILNDDNVTMTADFGKIFDLVKFDIPDLMNKAQKACADPELLKKMLGAGNRITAVTAACLAMPRKWDRRLVEIWAKAYTKAFR